MRGMEINWKRHFIFSAIEVTELLHGVANNTSPLSQGMWFKFSFEIWKIVRRF